MMKYMERVVFGGLALLLLPVTGYACSMSQWLATPTGVGQIIVGSPQTNPAVPRFSEFCGMQVTAPNAGHVQDNSPDGHTQFIARFYVRPNFSGTGNADLFVAYSAENGTGQLVKVSYNGTQLNFHAASTSVATVTAAANLWHLVEIEYNSAGTTRYWVNADAETAAQTGSYASATGAVSSVRLGLPNGSTGLTGSAQFDAYESHSSTPVGALLNADANDDLAINVFDFGFVRNEILGNSLATGQPDCNRDGAIDVFDFGCIRNIILGN